MNRTEQDEKPSGGQSGCFPALRAPLPRLGGPATARHPLRLLAVLISVLIASAALLTAPASAATSFARSATDRSECSTFGEAGCLYGTSGLAVDPTSGDVYIVEPYNNRVSEFSPTGEFLLAFGWGVRDGASELQTCTAATGCRASGGLSAAGQAGSFNIPTGVAVDSSGDVYAADFGNHRIEKFRINSLTHEAEFLLMFGGEVDQGPHHPGDLCTAQYIAEGDTCGAGTMGNAPGQIAWDGGESARALTIGGPGGNLYVGDEGRLDVFAPSGSFVEQVSLSAIASANTCVGALAVDPAGHLFVQMGLWTVFNGQPLIDHCHGEITSDPSLYGVHELEPSGTPLATLDPTGFASALALTPAGDLYLADPEGGLQLKAYRASSGQQFQAFDPETGGQRVFGMAFSPHTAQLYLAADNHGWIVPPPPPGPLIKQGSVSVVPERHGAAAFHAQVDPEGKQTEVKVEYVDQAHFEATGFAAAQSALVSVSAADFAYHAVEVKLPNGTLVPGTTYHWRLKATNPEGTAAEEGPEFEETPIALLDGPFATGVSSTAATLGARIDPLSNHTSYCLEWGPTSSYGETLVGDVGSGEAYAPISTHLTALVPHTAYHYRLVLTNPEGTIETPDHTFTTQLPAAPLALPDGRAYEQVSPPEKRGSAITSVENQETIQAAASGDRVAYVASSPFTDSARASGNVMVLSSRTASGWRVQEPMPTRSIPEGERQAGDLLGNDVTPPFLSTDLSRVLVMPAEFVKPLAPGATETTPYVWDAATEAYLPLVTPSDVETGARFGKRGSAWIEFFGATPDLSHVVLATQYALTTGSIAGPELHTCEIGQPCTPEYNLYEWSAGHLQLVNVLPDGHSAPRAFLGRGEPGNYDAHAISSDGRWIVWTLENPPNSGSESLYVRDMLAGQSFQVGGHFARFETMSADGSRLFYREAGDLHLFQTATQADTDLTETHPGEANAGVQAVIGASEDGRTLYLVAGGRLTGAQQNSRPARQAQSLPAARTRRGLDHHLPRHPLPPRRTQLVRRRGWPLRGSLPCHLPRLPGRPLPRLHVRASPHRL